MESGMKTKLLPLAGVIGLCILALAGLTHAFDSLSVPFPMRAEISPEGDLPSPDLLFRVQGATNTTYLREKATTLYDLGDRIWRLDSDREHCEYDGEALTHPVADDGAQGVVRDKITVFVESTSRFAKSVPVPVSLYVSQVSYPSRLTCFPDEDVFFTQASPLADSYSFTTVHYSFDESTLREAKAVEDDVYLQLPEGMGSRIYSLAQEISAGLDSPYERAGAIEAYLEANYVYDPDYRRAARGREPNYWFLFEEKKGMSANFNSAFVVLCRAAGVPARLVSGYRISPKSEVQEVYADQAHVWAEVALDGPAWIAFDATGPSAEPPVPTATVTTIDQITPTSDAFMKGDSFTVEGTVTATTASGVALPLADMKVQVYMRHPRTIPEGLLEEKGISAEELLEMQSEFPSEDDRRVGEGRTSPQGVFEIECKVPVEIKAGDDHVIARTLPAREYGESRSDAETVKIVSETSIAFGLPDKIPIGEEVRIDLDLREEPSYWTWEDTGILGGREHNHVGGEEVELYVDGKPVEKDTTGGESSYTYVFPERGVYSLRAEFRGTEYHFASSRETSLRLMRFPWFLLVIPLALSVLALAFLIWRRKVLSRFRFYLILVLALVGIACAAYGLYGEDLYPWIYLAFAPVAVWFMWFGYSLCRRLWGKRPPRGGGEPGIVPGLQGTAVPKAERKKAREGSIAIDFPQIREALPDVWGVGDELRISCSLKEGRGKIPAGESMEFYLDRRLLDRNKVDEWGRADLAHSIETKGIYVVGGKLGKKNKGERLIRIVDYREEIIALFNWLLQRWRLQGIDIPSEATPREIQQIVRSAKMGIDERLLDRIVGCFEETDYSEHLIERRHYEVMYLSQQALLSQR